VQAEALSAVRKALMEACFIGPQATRLTKMQENCEGHTTFPKELNIFWVDNICIKWYQYILHVVQPHHNHCWIFYTKVSLGIVSMSQLSPIEHHPDPNHLLPHELTTVLLQRDAWAAVPSASPSDACGSKTWGDHGRRRTWHATEMGDAGSRTLGQWIEKLSVTICQCQDKNWNWNPHVKEIHYESSFKDWAQGKIASLERKPQ